MAGRQPALAQAWRPTHCRRAGQAGAACRHLVRHHRPQRHRAEAARGQRHAGNPESCRRHAGRRTRSQTRGAERHRRRHRAVRRAIRRILLQCARRKARQLHALHHLGRAARGVLQISDAAQHSGVRADLRWRRHHALRRYSQGPTLRQERSPLRDAEGPPPRRQLSRGAGDLPQRLGDRRVVLRPREGGRVHRARRARGRRHCRTGGDRDRQRTALRVGTDRDRRAPPCRESAKAADGRTEPPSPQHAGDRDGYRQPDAAALALVDAIPHRFRGARHRPLRRTQPAHRQQLGRRAAARYRRERAQALRRQRTRDLQARWRRDPSSARNSPCHC